MRVLVAICTGLFHPMPCVNTCPFIEQTTSERIYHYLLYKITANWALKNKRKTSPKDKPEKHEEWTYMQNLHCSSTNQWQKVYEETITSASDSNLLILGCSLGITQKVLRRLAASQWPVITCIWTATPSRASEAPHGSFFSCQPHHWHNYHRKTGEQTCRLRPWCIWPGSPAPDNALENPARTL